jgi:hypothetical protein
MYIPWYEYCLWLAVIITKVFLFYICKPIRRLAFLRIFILYGLAYEFITLLIFFKYPVIYSQSIWLLDYIKYFISAMLAVQLATIKENKNISFYSFLTLLTIMFGFAANVQLSFTEPLLRMARFIDGLCIGITLFVFFQKMEKLYKNIAIGLSGILASDFICNTMQAIDHWNHWSVVRPLYAVSYLISVLVLVFLIRFGLSDNFQSSQVEELSLPAVELVPAQHCLLSPELYLP